MIQKLHTNKKNQGVKSAKINSLAKKALKNSFKAKPAPGKNIYKT